MEYKIEKNIPIPTGTFPIAKMEVGDSFLMPTNRYGSLQSANKKFREQGWRFRTRKTENPEVMRVWRIDNYTPKS